MVGGFCLVFHLLLSRHFFPSSKAHRRDLGSSAWPTYLPEDLGDENQGWRAHGYEPWPENHPQQLQQHRRDKFPSEQARSSINSRFLVSLV
jgi:hypothetical protein